MMKYPRPVVERMETFEPVSLSNLASADHADVRRIRTHDKRHIRRLPFVNREEGETCQHLATSHTRTRDEHIIAAIESQ